MPKISAPTVAAHRAAQRAALLTATEELLSEAGLAGVTPRAVAERAGLARSSFYEYFGSRDDILTSVALAAFDRWATEIDDAVHAVPPAERLHAYVQTVMRMTADGEHDIAATLQQADLSPSKREDIMALHSALLTPLAALLREAGVPDTETHTALVQGLLDAGMQLVGHGTPPDTAAATITALLRDGLPTADA